MGLGRVRALTPEFIQVFCCIFYDVEMGLARVRALTHFVYCVANVFIYGVEMGLARVRALTLSMLISICLVTM